MNKFKTELAIRIYSERPDRKPVASKRKSRDPGPSEWTLIFDCETTIDAKQSLRFGFYQVRKSDECEDEGVFFDDRALTTQERAQVTAYASAHGLKTLNVERFRRDVFLKYGYRGHATIVGFNLPFDLSRIAIAHGPARGHMRGGFVFKVSPSKREPCVRVKHLNPKAALIDFAIPWKQQTPEGMQRRKLRVAPRRGYFVDVKTFAATQLSQRFSLKSLAETLRTPTQKHDVEEHGQMSRQYLDYARADVQVTWECYRTLTRRYAEHGLSKQPDRLLSEASIGKAYLQQMGIKPLLEAAPETPRGQFGEMFCAYYGGRAEVRMRRVIREVVYCDFKSMYPTVNSLMGLWEFVIADGFTVHDATIDTQAFLDSVTIEHLQHPETWRRFRTLVRLKPDQDIFPARAKYNKETYTIGLNHLTPEQPLWYTLADCVVSKLLTGKSPRIEEAKTFRPGARQSGLKPVKVLGREDYLIDPATDDFFRRLIDLRDEAKEKKDPIEKTLKIIANSTSYGIFIEINRDDAPKSEVLHVFGPTGECEKVWSRGLEQPGSYFHPLLGVLITGAARLMLGLAERKTLDLGLDWAFCDTDSLAIVRPEGMSRQDFHTRVRKVVAWSTPLNPYAKRGSILKVEDLNRGIDSDKMTPLYCFAISAKRYALFNLTKGNRPVLRKASAHGLGHLLDPYPESDAPPDLPKPRVVLYEIGVHRCQHDFWLKIIQAALDDHPEQVLLDWHPSLGQPAAIRRSVSSPPLLNWFARSNKDRPYEQQIRPFGFMLAFMPRTGVFAPFTAEPIPEPRRGRPPKDRDLAPIAPYDVDPARALSKVFDHLTGKPVRPEQLKTYAEVLVQYHLSSEDKFENGQFRERGRTERRHVVATGFVWIGKEANQVGESGEEDPIWSAVEEFSRSSAAAKATDDA